MIMVDVTKIQCALHDRAIIFDHRLTVRELAEKSDTISYELLSALSPRIKRVFN